MRDLHKQKTHVFKRNDKFSLVKILDQKVIININFLYKKKEVRSINAPFGQKKPFKSFAKTSNYIRIWMQ